MSSKTLWAELEAFAKRYAQFMRVVREIKKILPIFVLSVSGGKMGRYREKDGSVWWFS